MSTALIAALERHFGHTTLSRGRTYAKTGQVTSWQVEPDQKTMTAVVRGSKTYRQQIHFAWSASGALTHVYGQCSCPMEYNCKHVAAAILVAQAAGALPDSTGLDANLEPTTNAPQNLAYAGAVNNAQDSRPALAPPMDNAIRVWLTQTPKQLAQTPVTVDPNEYPATVKDRIRYVVQQSRGRVNITPMKVTLRKDGSTSANTRARQYEFRHVRDEARARFVLPIDVRIFRLLTLSEPDYGMYRPTVPDNEEGQTLFRLVLETGRAHWEEADGQLLHLGKPRRGQFVWRHCGEAQQLMIKAEAEHDAEHADQRDATEQWLKALPMTLPWYVDPETGACGLLETEHTTEEIRWLASAPPVPATQADQVLAAMLQANIKLPRPNPVAQQWVTDIEPTPVLTLGAIKAREERYDLFRHYKLPYQKHEIAPMLRLSFDYDGHRIALDAPDTITHHAADGQLQLIARDQASRNTDGLRQ